MTKRAIKLDTPEIIRDKYAVEQVLAYFNIEIDSFGKCLCVYHDEDTPSMQVYENGVYCFGCRKYSDVIALAQHLLGDVSFKATITWFNDTRLPSKSGRTLRSTSNYVGEVPMQLIDYWHSLLDDDKYTQLFQSRLITKETADKYKLGWRPDSSSWVIPFWRGEPGNSLVDITQFRRVEGYPKYYGLYSHNRGSVMNAHLLEQPQEYVVILFGAYDSILAAQDGVIATATNGCSAFGESEKERLQQMYSKQTNIFVVPDNTASEYESAYRVAEWLNAEVRFFDTELPEDCDYIDYRKLGYTAQDFKQDVLGIEPITQVDTLYIQDILMFLQRGDPCKMASVHAIMRGTGTVAADVARTLAQQPAPYSSREWAKAKRKLWKVKSSDELVKTLNYLAVEANRLSGAW